MVLLACGINHKTAPLAVREAWCFADEQLEAPLLQLADQPDISEAAILSTCNRTELYCATTKPEAVFSWLQASRPEVANQLDSYWYQHEDKRALRHMIRVASGLDSMMIGEPQILGQVKRAYHKACSLGLIGQTLGRVFRQVFSASKRVRTDTEIGLNPTSVAYAGVSMMRHIFADPSQLTALCIGAGSTVELAAQHLASQGVRQFVFANRTIERAEPLAAKYQASAITINAIPEYLAQCDIVVTATASPLPLLGKGLLESCLNKRKHRPMFLLDLAVPRDIEPEVKQLADVYLYDIDDIQAIVAENRALREDAALKAEQIIEQQIHLYEKWQRSLTAVDTLKSFRSHTTAAADHELALAQRALAQGQPAEQVLAEFNRRLVNKIMHTPTVKLRSAGYHGREDLLRSARELFALTDDFTA